MPFGQILCLPVLYVLYFVELQPASCSWIGMPSEFPIHNVAAPLSVDTRLPVTRPIESVLRYKFTHTVVKIRLHTAWEWQCWLYSSLKHTHTHKSVLFPFIFNMLTMWGFPNYWFNTGLESDLFEVKAITDSHCNHPFHYICFWQPLLLLLFNQERLQKVQEKKVHSKPLQISYHLYWKGT